MTLPEKGNVQAVRRTLPPDEAGARLQLYSTSRRQVHAEPLDTSEVARSILEESMDPYPGIALSHRQRHAIRTTPRFMRNPELDFDVDEPEGA